MDRPDNQLYIREIEVKNLVVSTNVNLCNYGTMRDACNNFSYTFNCGKAYAFIGECGAGGWALSYTLAGREKDIIEGSIKINDKYADSKMLSRYSCYIGEGVIEEKRIVGYQTPIIRQIKNGVKLNKEKFKNANEVIKLFGLENEREALRKNIYKVGDLRWLASIAIGYSYAKRIYCFPWLNSERAKFVKNQLYNAFDILKNDGAIIVFPTIKLDTIKDIIDEVIYFKYSFEKM